MNELPEISPLELGKQIALLRERVNLKQAELARLVNWSPAVLSRVESGDRSLDRDELTQLLGAMNSPGAAELEAALDRKWINLPRPPLDHADQDLFWQAEQVTCEFGKLLQQPDVTADFGRRLEEYEREIASAATALMKRDHQVAFVGSIGIGKSTAICRLTNLEITDADKLQPTPVLEAGGGGITICAVHIRSGPGYGLLIEPRSDDEIRADVFDFVRHIRGATVTVGEESSDEVTQGISKEVERAIRNLAGLRVRREKLPDGSQVRRDEAKELSEQAGSERDLVVEILARMELHKRDRRDAWHEPATGKSPLVWLKDTFEQINNGRHPEFTLPKRIEVVVPDALLPLETLQDLSIRFVDTKGIDHIATRPDLEALFEEPHTVVVLCSGFNNAPAAEARLLIERAKEVGVRQLSKKAALLVLPRPNEALAVKDEDGQSAENVEVGYQLKREQIEMSLQPVALADLAVDFLNSYQDDPQPLRDFLAERIHVLRDLLKRRLQTVLGSAKGLLSNYQQEQARIARARAGEMLRSWLKQNASPAALSMHVQDGLLKQMSAVYAATVRASIAREGEWQNLNFGHHLGHGARRMAVLSLEKHVEAFNALCRTLSNTETLTEANDLIVQVEQVLRSSYDELLRKLQLMGQAIFKDELKIDKEFWEACQNEWGKGKGYKDRVTRHSGNWFALKERDKLESELLMLIQREWQTALERVGNLLEANQ